MNTVTSTRMRKIWMEGQSPQDSGKTVSSASSAGAENASLLKSDALPCRASGGGDPFAGSDAFFISKSDPSVDFRTHPAQQACEAKCHSSASTGSGAPAPADARDFDKGFKPVSDSHPFRRDLTLRHGRYAEDTRRPFCCRHGPNADKDFVGKGANDDEDDISSLIDNARLELQIEEEEEEEVKQNLQLLMSRQQRQDTDAYGLRGADGFQSTIENYRGSFFGPDMERISSRGPVTCSSAGRTERDLSADGKKGAMEHFRQNDSDPNSQLDTNVDSSPEESERQVLFILRKSTVNHHLSQDLHQSQDLQQDNVIGSTSYSAFSQPSNNWRNTPQPSYSVARAGTTSGGSSTSQDDGRGSFPDDAGHRATTCSSATTSLTADVSNKGLSTPRGREAERDAHHSDSSPFNVGLQTSAGPRIDNSYSSQCADETAYNGHDETEQRSSSVEVLAPADPFKNSPSKIRILGSKSYSEAYAASQQVSEDGTQGREGSGDQVLVPQGQSSRPKTDGGGPKDSNRKPVVVSVRPLSHAARRGHHSYLTQRHGNRHRQCQSKSHSNRHRQVVQLFFLPLNFCAFFLSFFLSFSPFPFVRLLFAVVLMLLTLLCRRRCRKINFVFAAVSSLL